MHVLAFPSHDTEKFVLPQIYSKRRSWSHGSHGQASPRRRRLVAVSHIHIEPSFTRIRRASAPSASLSHRRSGRDDDIRFLVEKKLFSKEGRKEGRIPRVVVHRFFPSKSRPSTCQTKVRCRLHDPSATLFLEKHRPFERNR